MADISLTASMRSNLLSLQNTQSLMDMTQERLSTGKKVNSAIDNPSSYYTAQSLSNRASDLTALMDSMGQGIQTIKAANEGIEAITTFVEQAKAISQSALDSAMKTNDISIALAKDKTVVADVANNTKINVTVNGKTKEITLDSVDATGTEASIAADTQLVAAEIAAKINAEFGANTVTATAGKLAMGTAATAFSIDSTVGDIDFSGSQGSVDRVNYSQQFNNILDQIDQLAKDSGYKGVNLLQGDSLKVIFNEDRTSYLDVEGKKTDSASLGLTEVTNWATNANIETTIKETEGAINSLRAMASEFGNNYAVVQNREDFTSSLVNVLEEGSDKLTLADMNEESANMLALQTRQQLAINSLSLASQASQSVLKLFG